MKLLLALAFILATALTPVGAWPVYILLFALVLAVEILSELASAYVLAAPRWRCRSCWRLCRCSSPCPGPALW